MGLIARTTTVIVQVVSLRRQGRSRQIVRVRYVLGVILPVALQALGQIHDDRSAGLLPSSILVHGLALLGGPEGEPFGPFRALSVPQNVEPPGLGRAEVAGEAFFLGELLRLFKWDVFVPV